MARNYFKLLIVHAPRQTVSRPFFFEDTSMPDTRRAYEEAKMFRGGVREVTSLSVWAEPVAQGPWSNALSVLSDVDQLVYEARTW